METICTQNFIKIIYVQINSATESKLHLKYHCCGLSIGLIQIAQTFQESVIKQIIQPQRKILKTCNYRLFHNYDKQMHGIHLLGITQGQFGGQQCDKRGQTNAMPKLHQFDSRLLHKFTKDHNYFRRSNLQCRNLWKLKMNLKSDLQLVHF